MAEKRDTTRLPKRVQVRYGEEAPTRAAFTGDISENGFFIRTALISAPRSILQIELTTQDRASILLEGEVRWAKKVPAALVRSVAKGGMGIRICRFLAGEEHYRQLCQIMRARPA